MLRVSVVIGSLQISGASEIELEVGKTRVLSVDVPEAAVEFLEWSVIGDAVRVNGDGVVFAEKVGEATVTVKYGALSDSVKVSVVEKNSGSGSGEGGSGSGEGGSGSGEGGSGSGEGGNDPHEHTFVSGKCECGATDPNYKPFGSEYPAISVSEALAMAESYTSAASTEKVYIVVTVGTIENLGTGEMYVFDASGEIYVYQSTYHDGSKLSSVGITEGDKVVICGTLRNYKGLLEIQTGSVLAIENDSSGSGEGGSGSGEGGSGSGEGGSGSGEGGSGSGSGDSGNTGGGSDDLDFTTDPYASMSKSEFYSNYTPAVCYKDSYYRNLHNFMSGVLTVPDAAPEISEYQPKSGSAFIKNTVTVFLDDGNTYVVYDAWGVEAFRVYRGGGYITLEEVAAHMYAFGTLPANHSSSKSTKPSSSPWGEYLRVNHTKFSGDTSRYPYEPELPEISGCGGSKIYYEMDIGTTGTDTGNGYEVRTYNNGSSIVRGAARIVYTWKDGNGNGKIDAYLGEVYVFYTYNHYNDFQEYLNYKGGWGEMFGNITGGGQISSSSNCNPTPYVPVAFGAIEAKTSAEVVVAFLPIERKIKA